MFKCRDKHYMLQAELGCYKKRKKNPKILFTLTLQLKLFTEHTRKLFSFLCGTCLVI